MGTCQALGAWIPCPDIGLWQTHGKGRPGRPRLRADRSALSLHDMAREPQAQAYALSARTGKEIEELLVNLWADARAVVAHLYHHLRRIDPA